MENVTFRDLYLISYLETEGHHYKAIVKKGSVYFFEYKNTPQINKDADIFLTGNATVEPLSYNRKLRLIRRLMYD